jgi:outer membrane protein OmpA-like peptidoglycan-associated protein
MPLLLDKTLFPPDYQYFPTFFTTMNKIFCQYLLILFLSFGLTLCLSAQDKEPSVERCKMLSQTSPIHNIWVDEENIKWVANSEGLHKVFALTLVQKVAVPSGTTSLLTIRGGNAQIEWNTAEMNTLLGGAQISSASYDPKTKSLWIGTQAEGAFQVSVSPLRVMQRFNMDNKKLTSNQINDIFIHENGTIWIATDDGMLTGNGEKWTLMERYLNFVGVDAWGSNLWILGDDFLWQVDAKGKWSPIAIELKNVEGKLRDIAVDDEGRVWIASNMMTGYDVAASRYQRFGPGQYFTSQFVNCLDVDQDGSIWTGTDDKGLYRIQWEAGVMIDIVMDSPLDCKTNQPTGALSVKAAGGEPPYTYAWSNGQTTDKIAKLPAGEYTLSVTDSKGLSKTGKYTIPDPSITISTEVIKPSSGSAEGDASVNLLVSGGTGTMTYKWDNGETTQLATKLTAGMHSVTVTDDSGCSATTAFDVSEKIVPLSVALTSLAEIKCADSAIGEIQANIKGGKAPIKYQWSDGSTVEGKLSSLKPGDYSITIADAAGQTASAFIKLTAPTPLLITSEVLSAANLGAENGQAQVKVTGGKAPYTYKWDNGITTPLVKTLSSGEHTLTVTDANGCVNTATVNVSENIATLAVIIKQVGQINCNGQSTASLRTDISGGKGPYTYQWSDGQTTATAENLSAGSHTVTVTDVVGTKFTSTSTISQPQPITVTITTDAPASTNSSDGKASAKASGGTGTFQYAWSNGELTNKALKLPSGTHTLTVTDAAGCSTTASVDISENILALQVTLDQAGTVKCNGGSDGILTASVKGGKEPYSYAWSNGATTASTEKLKAGSYSVTVTDVIGTKFTETSTVTEPQPIIVTLTTDAPASTNGSDGKASAKASGGTGAFQYAWSNGELTNKALKLPAGTHILTVTDAAGCSTTSSVTISENILELQVNIEQLSEVKCAGTTEGSIKAVVSGGKEPYTFSWNNDIKSSTLQNLGDGLYTLTVTDAVGQSATSVITVFSPKPMSVLMKAEQAATTNQKDAKASATVTGGTGKYTYAWDNGEKTAKALALDAGTHTITVTDENGCTIEGNVVITENILPLAASIKQTEKILCANQTTAALTASVTGGKSPYTIQWKGPGKDFTGESISQLAAGEYAMQVVDAAGSSATSSIVVTAPKPLVVTAEEISPANTGSSDGSLTLKASGGSGKYSVEGHTWTTGASSHKIDLLKPGSYTYVVKDDAGCSAEVKVTITEDILPLTVGIKETTQIKCAGTASANLEATVKGGKGPYTYSWSNGAASASASNVGEGTITLSVTDATGQKAQSEIKVNAPPKLTVDPTNLRSATNDRISDGKGSVDAKGGAGPYTYKWSSGETGAQASKLPLGQGNVIVTDQNGCTASADFIIKEKVLPELTAARLSSGEPIRMEKIQFDADSIVIKPEAVPSIDELYEFLYDNPTIIIEVSGHTNSLPADDYCDRISTARAKSVADYLTNKGIEPRRVISIGHGKRKPIATNQTPEGRKKNQRVEIRLIKIEE